MPKQRGKKRARPAPEKGRRSRWSELGKIIGPGLMMTLGALLVAIGLELFLIPNKIIDGGVVGVAIISSYLTQLPVALFLIALNLPFLWLGYKQIGKTFAISTLYAVVVMSALVTYMHRFDVLTDDLLLASVFGGVILGLGVGIIIRSGGSLDGTEIVAIVLTRQVPFSVGEIVMFFNIFILGSAGFVFGWDRAMYSLIAFFVAFKSIDVAIEGLDESKSVIVITEQPDEIRDAVLHRLGRGVTEIAARGGYSQTDKSMLYCVITRLELAKLKSIILEKDENAFVVIENVHDVLGGQMAKRSIH